MARTSAAATSRHQHERQLVAAVAPHLADVFREAADAPVKRAAAAADHDAGSENDERQLPVSAHVGQDIFGRSLGAGIVIAPQDIRIERRRFRDGAGLGAGIIGSRSCRYRPAA